MNRRTFLTATPLAAAATWTVTCKYEEPKKEKEKTAGFHIEYYYVGATYWDDKQMLQNAIVDDCDLSGTRFKDVQNACDNIHDHNKKYFERHPSDQMIDYQIWYHGFDDNHYMVGELTLGKNGVNTFVKQWVMNNRHIAQLKKEIKRKSVA